MKIKKMGLSLITLVITIIVLGILAGAVIVSLSNTNVIEQTSESVFKDTVSKIKEKIEIEKMNKLINAAYSFDNIIPDKYQEVLKLTSDGCLIYIGDETSQQKEWAESLGVKIIGQEAVSQFRKLKEIENLATSYRSDANIITSRNELVTQYVRRNRYTGLSWEIFAGRIDTNFSTYVENNKTQTLFSNNEVLKDPITGKNIDFVHQVASLNACFYSGKTIYDDYAGWAGDLCTVLGQVHDYSKTGTYTKEELIAYAESLIGSTSSSSTMDISDTLADIDAANISDLMTEDAILSDIMFSYYYGEGENTCANRYALYKKHMEKISEAEGVRNFKDNDPVYSVALNFLGANSSFETYVMPIITYDRYKVLDTLTQYATAVAYSNYINGQL